MDAEESQFTYTFSHVTFSNVDQFEEDKTDYKLVFLKSSEHVESIHTVLYKVCRNS